MKTRKFLNIFLPSGVRTVDAQSWFAFNIIVWENTLTKNKQQTNNKQANKQTKRQTNRQTNRKQEDHTNKVNEQRTCNQRNTFIHKMVFYLI